MATRKLDKPRQIRHGISDLSRLTHRQQPVFRATDHERRHREAIQREMLWPKGGREHPHAAAAGDGRGGGEKLMDQI